MKYTVYASDTVSSAGTFEADTYEEALEQAYNELDISTCHQCPEIGGAPTFVVFDDSDNTVYDDSYYTELRKRVNDLEAELERVQGQRKAALLALMAT